jgi:hypothetical protein
MTIPPQLTSLVTSTRDQVGRVLRARFTSPEEAYGQIADIYRQPFVEAGEILTQADEPPQELSAAWFRANTALEKSNEPRSVVQAYSGFFKLAQQVCTQLASPVVASAVAAVPPGADGQPATAPQPAANSGPPETPHADETAPPPEASQAGSPPAVVQPQAQPQAAKVTPAPADPAQKLLDDLQATGCKIEAVGGSTALAALRQGRIKATDQQGRTYTPTNPDEFSHFVDYQLGNHDRLPNGVRQLVGVFDDLYKDGYRFYDKESDAELKHPLDAYDSNGAIEIRKGDKLKWFVNSTQRLTEFGNIRLGRMDQLDPKARSEFEILDSLSKKGWTFTQEAKAGAKARNTQSALVAHWWLEDAGTITVTDPSSGGTRKVKQAELQKLRSGG